MNDNVISLNNRRPIEHSSPFEGTVLAALGRVPSRSLGVVTITAQRMTHPVTARLLVDVTWPASALIEQIQVIILREPTRNATLTRRDGAVVGDSEFLFYCPQFMESHATTIAEALSQDAVLEFDPITGWVFDVSLRETSQYRTINAGQLVEVLEQDGAVPLNYSPQMADTVQKLFRGEEVGARDLVEVLQRDRIVHFPPPGTVDSAPQLLVYWVLRELELNVEYMQVIDLVAERFPLAVAASEHLVRTWKNGPQPRADVTDFLVSTGFLVPEEGDRGDAPSYGLSTGSARLLELHPYFAHYAVLGQVCARLDENGDLAAFPEWNPARRHGFAEFDLRSYAEEVSALGRDGNQPRP